MVNIYLNKIYLYFIFVNQNYNENGYYLGCNQAVEAACVVNFSVGVIYRSLLRLVKVMNVIRVHSFAEHQNEKSVKTYKKMDLPTE